jgi:outer membrane protein OmpA-like peptidoglycan-associated protein
MNSIIAVIAALSLGAQTVPPPSSVPLYRVTVEQSSAKAINYRYLKSSTKIDFTGTVLAPTAKGEAKIESEAAATRIKAKFEGLPEPTSFGPEYLTYVLWGVSPEGRANNLGEIQMKHGKAKLKASEPLQAFGLVVTAEPYFAVTQPSNVVVMENAVRKDTKGNVELIDAKYDLLKRGQYHMNAAKSEGEAAPMAKDTPPAVLQARNAVMIAETSGAPTYAADAYGKAQKLLAQSESKDGSKKERLMAAREAIQGAEDARLISVKRQEQEIIENDRKEAQAKLDRAKQEADEAAAKAATDLAAANQSRMAAMNDNTNLRGQLLTQLNAILQTRATTRGLIVNMSGVNFKTGKATLMPSAREKLAKIAGLILAHPGLKLESEGYTDSTGSDELNQKLSEQRAQAARDYLVAQGVSPDAIISRGLGKASPIASNDTAKGRLDNRRVELVVSGTGITATPVAN